MRERGLNVIQEVLYSQKKNVPGTSLNYILEILEEKKIKKIQKNAAARKGRQYLLIIGSRSQHLLPYSQTGRRFSPPEP